MSIKFSKNTEKYYTVHSNIDLDLIAGVCKDESSPRAKNKTQTEEGFREAIIQLKDIFHNLNDTKLLEYYMKGVDKNDSETIRWKMSAFYSELELKCPTYHFAKRYAELSSNHSNVFFYELTHTSEGPAFEKEFGVPHGSDLVFVFGLPLLKPNDYSKEDLVFSKQVMKYWTDFSKYG